MKIHNILIVVLMIILYGITACRHHDQTTTDRKGPGRKTVPNAVHQNVASSGSQSEADEFNISENQHFSLTAEEEKRFAIHTETIHRTTLHTYLNAMGKVFAHPYRKAIVAYAFPARITDIHARIGQWVDKGQLLVTLQSSEVGEAKSQFIKVCTEAELAQMRYEREKGLFDKGITPRKSIQEAQAALQQAQTSLEAAEKRLHVLGFDEDQVKEIATTHHIHPVISLHAPIAGKVVQSNATLGIMVDQSSEIMTIMDPHVLCVDAQIFERDIPAVQLGQETQVTVPAYPGQIFKGRISYIGDVLKEETRTVTVRLEVSNTGLKLKPGMFASVQVNTRQAKDVVAIPASALLSEKGQTFIFIRENRVYSPRIVALGARENGYVEVINGKLFGKEVVIAGAFSLKAYLQGKRMHEMHLH